MMRRLLARRLVAFPALMAATLPAWAQAPDRPADHPPLAPTRESSVLYRMIKPGIAPFTLRTTIRAGGSPMRFDMPDSAYILVDQSAHTANLVVPNEQTVMALPFEEAPQALFQVNERMRFTRRSTDTVATLRCTTWDVMFDKARGSMCITDDGILLRSSGQDEAGRRTQIEALSVSFTPAPASDFVLPPDFERMESTPNAQRPQ